MASAAIGTINGVVGNVMPPPEALIIDHCTPNAAAFGWLGSPRISFSHDGDDQQKMIHIPNSAQEAREEDSEEEDDDIVLEFEFSRLSDPVTMLPADELFSDGKLVPLHLRPPAVPGSSAPQKLRVETAAALGEPYAFSPRAPVRCASRWRELFGLKKAKQQKQKQQQDQDQHCNQTCSTKLPTTTITTTATSNPKPNGALRHYLLHRSSRPTSGESFSSSDWSESLSRFSLSSSSSSSAPDHEDLHRFSLDADRAPPSKLRISNPKPASRSGRSRVRAFSPRGSSVDSPRMNSYGRIVFQNLERSSSSPSTFNSKLLSHHHQHRAGMERSYSTNIRIAPVLNVPVCSLRVASSSSKSSSVFGFLSPQKNKDSSPYAALRRGH